MGINVFTLGLTVNQVLKGLWCLILDRTNINIQNDLKKRLKEELIEMNGQCTSGHLSRLINVIQGKNVFWLTLAPIFYHNSNKYKNLR